MSTTIDGIEYDRLGIRKIYPNGGKYYYMINNATTLTQLQDNGKFTGFPSGTVKTPDDSAAWRIPASGGFARPHFNISGLTWRNYEITATVRIVDSSTTTPYASALVVQMYGNGEHHGTPPTEHWMGSANKGRLWFNGNTSYIKELYHEPNNTGYTPDMDNKPSGLGSFRTDGRWITWKFISRNKTNNTQRHNEIWVDTSGHTPYANNWVKSSEYTDTGNLYASAGFDAYMNNMKTNYPNSVPKNRDLNRPLIRNDIVTWAGGWITFRSDYVTYDIKNASAREIAPLA